MFVYSLHREIICYEKTALVVTGGMFLYSFNFKSPQVTCSFYNNTELCSSIMGFLPSPLQLHVLECSGYWDETWKSTMTLRFKGRLTF